MDEPSEIEKAVADFDATLAKLRADVASADARSRSIQARLAAMRAEIDELERLGANPDEVAAKREALARSEETLAAQDREVAKQSREADLIERRLKRARRRTRRTIRTGTWLERWAIRVTIVFWPIYTVLLLTAFNGHRANVRSDYFVAIATLLPVLFIAGIAQTIATFKSRLRSSVLLVQCVPLALGEGVALYALAVGHASVALVVQTATSAATAFAWVVTGALD